MLYQQGLQQLAHEIDYLQSRENFRTPVAVDFVLAAVEIFYPLTWPTNDIIFDAAVSVTEVLAQNKFKETAETLAQLVYDQLERCIDKALDAKSPV